MSSESRDFFKFWEISGNSSLMVQNRDSCNGTLIGNRSLCGLSNGTSVNALE